MPVNKIVANSPRATGTVRERTLRETCQVLRVPSGSNIEVPNTGKTYCVVIMPEHSTLRPLPMAPNANGLILAEACDLHSYNKEKDQQRESYVALTDYTGEKPVQGQCLASGKVLFNVAAQDYPTPVGDGTATVTAPAPAAANPDTVLQSISPSAA